MKKLTKLALITTLGVLMTPSLYSGLIDIDIKIGVTTCTGGASTCSTTISAMGEVVELDVAKLPVKDLGTISQDQVINLTIPANKDDKNVYSYTPSEGELTGTKIYLTLDNQPPRAGTRLAGKTVIKMYRQLEGNTPNQWIDVGEIYTVQKDKTLPVNELPFTFKKDGNLETENPNKVLPDGTFAKVTFVLGQRNVNPPQ